MQFNEQREAFTLTNQGKKIFGILHLPINCKGPVPAVVICPGFAGNKSGKYRIFVEFAQGLASCGIAVARFDYRGAGDSEGDFSEITIETQLSDVLACLNFVQLDHRINSNKLGLLGRSLGGMIAVLAAYEYTKICSLALWAAVYDNEPWKKIWEKWSAAFCDMSQIEVMQQLPSNIPAIPGMEFLKQFFQVELRRKLAEINHIPLLHIHGKQDEFVKFEQALAYETACQANPQTKFIHLNHSNHDFSFEEERKLAIVETINWFKKTLADL